MKAKLIVAALALTLSTAAPAAVPEDDAPLKLALNEWTGQHITTRVAGEILKRMGYSVEYVTAGYYPQMQAMEDNTISATLEIWSSNIGEHYDKALASGNVVEIGDLGLEPVETWLYNRAAADACPGLPDYRALNVPAGSEGALVAEIQGAEARAEPLLVMFWSPHWVHAVVELRQVTLPPFEEGCQDDPAVGVNPNATWDCDWARGYIKKMAWVGLADKWPAAYKLLQAYELRNEDQIPMMNAIDQEGGKLEDVVDAWLDANQSRWQRWVDAAVR